MKAMKLDPLNNASMPVLKAAGRRRQSVRMAGSVGRVSRRDAGADTRRNDRFWQWQNRAAV